MRYLLIIPALLIATITTSCKKTRHCHCSNDEITNVTKLDIGRKKEQTVTCEALATEGFECEVRY